MTLATSISSFETSVGNFFVETEADVQTVVLAFQKGVAIAVSDINSALAWVAKETPTIVPIIEEALSLAAQVGLSANPTAGPLIAAAQVAITELNTVAQAQNSGLNAAQTLAAAYAAYTTGQAAGASVKAAAIQSVASTVTATPAA